MAHHHCVFICRYMFTDQPYTTYKTG